MGRRKWNSYWWSTCRVPIPVTQHIQVAAALRSHASQFCWSCWHENATGGYNFLYVFGWSLTACVIRRLWGFCQFFSGFWAPVLPTSPVDQTHRERWGWGVGLILSASALMWAEVLHSVLVVWLLTYLFLAPFQQSIWTWHEKQILINSLNNW